MAKTKSKIDKSEAMGGVKTLRVVASRDGMYGKIYRTPGEAFTIVNPDASFSDKWMVDIAAEPDRAKALEAGFKAAGGVSQVSAEAAAAELAQATGNAMSLVRHENLTLKAKIAELEKAAGGGEPDEPAPDDAAPTGEDTLPAPAERRTRRR